MVERFPVGRQLAFDAARGRLWVVCPRCARWNLSPLEERWEAIEACERLYRGTPRKASTDNIGLAKLSERLQLVRAGKPTNPEFAAWRYGREFQRRRVKTWAVYGGSATLVLGLTALRWIDPTVHAAIPAAGTFPSLFNCWTMYRQLLRPVGRVPYKDALVTLRRSDLGNITLELDDDAASWRLNVLHKQGRRRLPRLPTTCWCRRGYGNAWAGRRWAAPSAAALPNAAPRGYRHASSTSRTRVASAAIVNGFGRNSTPGFSTPCCTITLAVYPDV